MLVSSIVDQIILSCHLQKVQYMEFYEISENSTKKLEV